MVKLVSPFLRLILDSIRNLPTCCRRLIVYILKVSYISFAQWMTFLAWKEWADPPCNPLLTFIFNLYISLKMLQKTYLICVRPFLVHFFVVFYL